MAPFPEVSGETQEQCLSLFPNIASTLLGKPATHFRELAHDLKAQAPTYPSLRCGLETALLDAYCRASGIPLWGLWGGADVRARETDITLPIGETTSIVEMAKVWSTKGFRTFKMKVGQDVEDDIRRIEAVFAACPEASFVLDANQGFSLHQAQEFLKIIQRYDFPVVLFEQPVPREDFDGLLSLTRQGTIPIAADESVRSLTDAHEMIQRQAVDVLNIKITKCGVIESLDIASLAKASSTSLMIGGMVESRIAMGCSWSLVLGCGGFQYLDLDMPLLLETDPLRGGYRNEGPFLHPWDQPGLGIEITPESSSLLIIQ